MANPVITDIDNTSLQPVSTSTISDISYYMDHVQDHTASFGDNSIYVGSDKGGFVSAGMYS